MGKWFDKYMTAIGDFTKVPENVYTEIRTNIKQLEQETIDVSIVVIGHNEEKHILPCVWSLSDMKTNLSVEIIVVNNASKDRTQEVIDRMGVRTVYQPKLGHGNARQAGLDVARGKYHFSADSDTLYPPTYVDTMVKYLSKPGVSTVFSTHGFYPDGKKGQLSLTIYEVFRDTITRLRAIQRPELTTGGAAMAFYTEQAKQVGWRTNILRGEDGSMLLALKKFGKPVFVTSRKARIATSSRRLDADGSLGGMIWKRFKKEASRIHELFVKKKEYIDEDSNLRKDQ